MAIEHRFNPYTDNGGTSLAIAGSDFCIVAADTRQSEGYLINTRYAPKAYKLTNTAVLATNGYHADGQKMAKDLLSNIRMYNYQHGKDVNVGSIAQLTSIVLYGRRFFPYYTFNILGGLDEQGVGAVYSFDPVGSFEREPFRAGGSGASLIQPFLDNQIGRKNIVGDRPQLSLEEAIKITKDAFTSAAERDIHTGDYVEIWIITKNGVDCQKFDIRKD